MKKPQPYLSISRLLKDVETLGLTLESKVSGSGAIKLFLFENSQIGRL